MAPFCRHNGNTFVVVMRDVISKLNLSTSVVAAARSRAGHIVAGVASGEEERAFRLSRESLLEPV